MATTSQPVTAENLLSATVKYSNKDDSARVYDISANVHIQDGSVSNFENGEVKKVSTDSEPASPMDGMVSVATFNAYGERNLNLYINNADETEAQSILTAVYAFMADVKANVNANPVNA